MYRFNKSRRNFFKTITFAGGTLFISGLGAYFIYRNPETVDRVISKLERHQKGRVIRDRILLEEYRTDFGKVVTGEPRVVVIPNDEQDIIAIFKIANELQVPVSIRGAGHTCFGQSLSDGGILVANRSLNAEFSLIDNQISVSTRSQWMELETGINPMGYTSPVLTDFLELTVGGTLSVGGYGLRSFLYGSQADNITEMEMILSDGQRVTCSAKSNSDLFRFSLCGLGQLGFISKVKFKPIDYKPYTLVFYILCRTIDEYISTVGSIMSPDFVKQIDHFSSYWVGGSFIIEIGRSYGDDKVNALMEKFIKTVKGRFSYYKKTMIKDYHLFLHRIRNDWVNQYSPAHHLWEDYIFELEGLKNFLSNVILKDKIQRQQDILPALYLVACNNERSGSLPFSPTYGKNTGISYSVGFYYMIKFGDQEKLILAKQKLKDSMEYCIEAGGRPYLYGWHDLSENQKKHFYGDDYEKMKLLKRRYDPNNIVNPGKLIA